MTDHNKSTNIKTCLVAPQAKGHNSTKQVRTMLIATPGCFEAHLSRSQALQLCSSCPA
jgi:hypothetical protein